MNRFSLLGGILLLTSSLLSAETLNLTAGTMTSGGALGLNYKSADWSNWSTSNLSGKAEFNFGYFVVDNLALIFDIAGAGKFTIANAGQKFSLGINLMYAIDTGTMVRPYGQFGAFGAFVNSDSTAVPPTTTSNWAWGVKPAVGLLVGLNEHVALDFGVQANLQFPITSTTDKTSLEGGVGYFGVRAFF